MTQKNEHEVVYDDTLIDKLELRWGRGFMSPGGPDEIAELVAGVELKGRRILDFGCGTGGPATLLAGAHGASQVLGVDLEPRVLERAEQHAAASGVSDTVRFLRIDAGPLDFPDRSFDVVFTVGAIIHHPNRPRLFRDFLRILEPGGHLVMSDWYATTDPFTEEMRAWVSDGDDRFDMATLEGSAGLVQEAGFEEVETRDRNEWFVREARRDLDRLNGELWRDYVDRFGEESALVSRRIAETFVLLAEQGQLRPGYVRATTPLKAGC